MQRSAVQSTLASPNITAASLSTTVLTPEQYGFKAVSYHRHCQLKDGAATSCQIQFTSSSLSSSYQAGQPLYLVFSMESPGQVSVWVTWQARQNCRLRYIRFGEMSESHSEADLVRIKGHVPVLVVAWADVSGEFAQVQHVKHTFAAVVGISPW